MSAIRPGVLGDDGTMFSTAKTASSAVSDCVHSRREQISVSKFTIKVQVRKAPIDCFKKGSKFNEQVKRTPSKILSLILS